MCFSQPSYQAPPPAPTRENVVSQVDTSQMMAAQEKKRKGYAATNPTGGAGLMDVATIKKVTTGS